MGKPWAEMDTKTLQLALSTPNPMITTEMQDHIRGILAVREKSTGAEAKAVEPEVVEPVKEVSHV